MSFLGLHATSFHPMSSQRLQKILAQAGIASRRKAEEMISLGMVTVNGQIAKLGDKATWGQDAIKVNGKLLTAKQAHVYLAFYKPKAVISAMEDPEGRPAMGPYLNKVQERVFSIGRLDFNSEGLLLLTNDGDLAEKVQKSEKIPRVYLVKVKGHPDAEMLSRLERGGKVGERYFRPQTVRKFEEYAQKALVQIVAVGNAAIDIKAYVESKGFLVEKITRQAIGHITLHGLEPGHYRFLQKSQLEALVEQPELGQRRLEQEGEKIDARAERKASIEDKLEALRGRRPARPLPRKKIDDSEDQPRPSAWASPEARARREAWKTDTRKPLSRDQGRRAWEKSQEDGGTDEVKFKKDRESEGRQRPRFGKRGHYGTDRPAYGSDRPRREKGSVGGARPKRYEDLFGEPGKPQAPARRPRQPSGWLDQEAPTSRPPAGDKGLKIHFGRGKPSSRSPGEKPSSGGRKFGRGKPASAAGGRSSFGRGKPAGGAGRGGFGRGKPAGGGRTGGGGKPRGRRPAR